MTTQESISKPRRRPPRSLLWLLILALLMPSVGAVLAAPLAPELNRALAAISQYTDNSSDLADDLVKRLGFTPAIADDEWMRLPTIHKLEMAYRASEAADPGKGGQHFLALMSRQLAQMYDAVEQDPTLRVHVETSKSLLGAQVRFAPPGPRQGVPGEVKKAIIVLAEYAAAGTESAFQMFTNPATFDMPADDAYELLATSQTHAEALTRALEKHSPEKQAQILRGLTLEVRSRYDGAKYEKALDPFDTKNAVIDPRPPPPDGTDPGGRGPEGDGPGGAGPGGAGPGGAGPGTGRPGDDDGGRGPKGSGTSGIGRDPPPRPIPPPGSRRSSSVRYQQFLDGHHPRGQRSFSLMTKGSRGFGGVVFGDVVTSKLPAIRTITQNDNILKITTSDGSVLTYGPVSPDLVQAAYRIVYTGFGGLAPLEPGEGVGLVSIRTTALPPKYDCDSKKLTLDITPRTELTVLLHPALVDTDLGWAALMADIMPLAPEALIDGGIDPVAAKRAVSLFRSNQYGLTWKVLDVPIELSRDAERVSLRRVPDIGEHLPEGLLQTNFIKMVPFGWADFRDTRFTERFDRAFSDLARVYRDIDTLNRFATTLALVRQAHSDGATFTRPPKRAPATRTPEVLWLDDSGLHARQLDRKHAVRTEVDRLQRCFDAVKTLETEAARQFKAELVWALLWTRE